MARQPRARTDGISGSRIRRTAPAARLAVRATGEAVVDALRRHDPDPERYARRAERYVEVLGRSKGALMKAGQMFSFIPVGSSFAPHNRSAFEAAMGRLQADAPPMAPELAAEVVREELDGSPEQLFAEFLPEPIAAASIGQVHAARLHDGRRVAVKVQYPGVAKAIRADLRNAELLAVFFQLVSSIVPGVPRMDTKAVAAEISERVLEELDYGLEASNQAFFADAYENHPFIKVPKVVPELSSARVLTQELVEGLSWSDALQADQSLRNAWAETIYRFAHRNIQSLHAFNADPHPGNYVFHRDGTVSFLDFGCVKRFSPTTVAQNCDLYRANLHEDHLAYWRTWVQTAKVDTQKGPTPEDLQEYYRVRCEQYRAAQPFSFSPGWMSRVTEHELSISAVNRKIGASVGTWDFALFIRLDLGVLSILSQLRATIEQRAVMTELFDGGRPATPLGEAEASFWKTRLSTERALS